MFLKKSIFKIPLLHMVTQMVRFMTNCFIFQHIIGISHEFTEFLETWLDTTVSNHTVWCDQNRTTLDVTYWSVEQCLSWCLSLLTWYLLLVSCFSISLQLEENLVLSCRNCCNQSGLWVHLWAISLSADWCRRSQPTVGSAIARLVALRYLEEFEPGGGGAGL